MPHSRQANTVCPTAGLVRSFDPSANLLANLLDLTIRLFGVGSKTSRAIGLMCPQTKLGALRLAIVSKPSLDGSGRRATGPQPV